MSLSFRLDVRQSQSLVLTPQLQQAIKLLQMSNMELAGAVEGELAENPFLDRVEPAEQAQPKTDEREQALDGALHHQSSRENDDGWSPPATEAAADRRLRVSSGTAAAAEPDGDLQGRLSRGPTLAEHLRAQIHAEHVDKRIQGIALVLVDWLEEDGYLRESDAVLAQRLGASPELVTAARAVLLRCDPTGVGAENLAQCLAAQLAERDRCDPAMRALLSHLALVARADFAALQRHCGVDLDDIRDMIGEIKRLDPRPGLSFMPADPIDVVPDLMVYRANKGQWRIELNQATVPRVLVNRSYYAELTRTPLGRREREFMSERYQAASWLAKALDQRARTILRVGRAIFVRQLPFLEAGPHKLRPLVLRDIAEATGLHESTVSRATADKFASTPRGTFPLRYFFSVSIPATAGEEGHSAEAIRQRIKQMIEAEDTVNVLSDDQIVLALKAKGILIARRTIAKYRESLGIPSSVQRRRSKALSL